MSVPYYICIARLPPVEVLLKILLLQIIPFYELKIFKYPICPIIVLFLINIFSI